MGNKSPTKKKQLDIKNEYLSFLNKNRVSYSKKAISDDKFIEISHDRIDWKYKLTFRLEHIDGVEFEWKYKLLPFVTNLKILNEQKLLSDIFWCSYNTSLKTTRYLPSKLSKRIKPLIWKKKNAKQPSNKFLQLMKKIEDQMMEKSHPLSKVMGHFESWYCERYFRYFEANVLNKLNKQKEAINEICIRSINDVKKFVSLIKKAILDFYNIKLISGDINKELAHIIATKCILKGDVYNIIFNLITQKNKQDIGNLFKKMLKLKKITLKDVNVNEYFRFDYDFRNKFKDQIVPLRYARSFDNLEEALKESPSPKPEKNEVSEEKLKSVTNFKKCISDLRNVKNVEDPERKLECFSSDLTRNILEAVDVFWKGFDVKQSKLTIDADNLLNIYIFIVIKTQYAKLITEHELINEFICDSSRMSSLGYHLATFAVAIEYILKKMDTNLIKQKENVERMRQSISKINRFRQRVYANQIGRETKMGDCLNYLSTKPSFKRLNYQTFASDSKSEFDNGEGFDENSNKKDANLMKQLTRPIERESTSSWSSMWGNSQRRKSESELIGILGYRHSPPQPTQLDFSKVSVSGEFDFPSDELTTSTATATESNVINDSEISYFYEVESHFEKILPKFGDIVNERKLEENKHSKPRTKAIKLNKSTNQLSP